MFGLTVSVVLAACFAYAVSQPSKAWIVQNQYSADASSCNASNLINQEYYAQQCSYYSGQPEWYECNATHVNYWKCLLGNCTVEGNRNCSIQKAYPKDSCFMSNERYLTYMSCQTTANMIRNVAKQYYTTYSFKGMYAYAYFFKNPTCDVSTSSMDYGGVYLGCYYHNTVNGTYDVYETLGCNSTHQIIYRCWDSMDCSKNCTVYDAIPFLNCQSSGLVGYGKEFCVDSNYIFPPPPTLTPDMMPVAAASVFYVSVVAIVVAALFVIL